MQRLKVPERPDWPVRVEALGFDFHSPGGQRYWDESVVWTFTLDEIERQLEAPTAEIESLCFAFVERAVADETVLRRLAIPEAHWATIAESWQRGDRNLYGRLDLAYDGSGPAKLLEYNADTPTSLLEAAVVQWAWLEEAMTAGVVPRGADQYNSIHERLIEALRQIRGGTPFRLHLAAAADSPEDQGTVAYLAECARQAGLQTALLDIEQIGLASDGRFVDADARPIEVLFKLYPWEWMFREAFGDRIAGSRAQFIEPPWKALLSNKGLLPFLWEMATEHPNLLPAFFADDPRANSLVAAYVEKPIYSREGANVRVHGAGASDVATEGPYGAEGAVRQALAPLASTGGGGVAVVGSWLIASEPAGIGIREDDSLVTRDTARFVPHLILP